MKVEVRSRLLIAGMLVLLAVLAHCNYARSTGAAAAIAGIHAVQLAWDENTEPDLAGYRIYHGPASGIYTNVVVLGRETNACVEVSGRQYFALSAFNEAGAESAKTWEVFYDPPAKVLLVTERSLDGVWWIAVWTNTVQAAHGVEFYRLSISREAWER